jgi:hypothetical protein
VQFRRGVSFVSFALAQGRAKDLYRKNLVEMAWSYKVLGLKLTVRQEGERVTLERCYLFKEDECRCATLTSSSARKHIAESDGGRVENER